MLQYACTLSPAPRLRAAVRSAGLAAAAFAAATLAAFLTGPAPAHAQEGADAPARPGAEVARLLGAWDGAYFDCYVCTETGRVDFDVTFWAEGAGVVGDSAEPNTFGAPDAPTLYADWRGGVVRGAVRLTKTYDGAGGVSHSVIYVGRFAAPDLVVGRWRIGQTVGRFELRRRSDLTM